MIRETTESRLIGKRVRLLSTSDVHTKLKRGDEGVVTYIDDYGTVHVKWDNGSRLGMLVGEDWFEEIHEEERES